MGLRNFLRGDTFPEVVSHLTHFLQVTYLWIRVIVDRENDNWALDFYLSKTLLSSQAEYGQCGRDLEAGAVIG